MRLNFLLAAALAVGANTAAAEAGPKSAPIFQAEIGAADASKFKRFVINPDLGRAWVEIDIYQDLFETQETHRVAVPGLTYNPQTAQVLYEVGGQQVVCATVEKGGAWIFTHDRIEPTGNCEFRRHYATVQVDDGFSVQTQQRMEVRLITSSHEDGERS